MFWKESKVKITSIDLLEYKLKSYHVSLFSKSGKEYKITLEDEMVESFSGGYVMKKASDFLRNTNFIQYENVTINLDDIEACEFSKEPFGITKKFILRTILSNGEIDLRLLDNVETREVI